MRKLLLCLAVAGTCLIPSPRPSAAALPCGSVCCSWYGSPTAQCMYYAGVWTTCGWYWANVAACPVPE